MTNQKPTITVIRSKRKSMSPAKDDAAGTKLVISPRSKYSFMIQYCLLLFLKNKKDDGQHK